ncbi:MAG TPA: hypothetical protein VGQ83_25500 [Polyangia bacterium]|jgi:hypothetical protein
MEHALLVTRAADLAHWEARYTRLYLGHDLCARLLPGPAACDEVARFARARGVRLTFVTPLADSLALGTIRTLLARLAAGDVLDEAVVNDYGVLGLVARDYPGLALAAGRALSFANPLGDTTALADLGVRRVEYDLELLLRLGAMAAPDGGLPWAAYYPHAVVNCSRYCPTAGASGRPPGIQPCRKECRATPPLRVSIDPRLCAYAGVPRTRAIVLKGNSLLATAPLDPACLAPLGLSRLIYEPELPV